MAFQALAPTKLVSVTPMALRVLLQDWISPPRLFWIQGEELPIHSQLTKSTYRSFPRTEALQLIEKGGGFRLSIDGFRRLYLLFSLIRAPDRCRTSLGGEPPVPREVTCQPS